MRAKKDKVAYGGPTLTEADILKMAKADQKARDREKLESKVEWDDVREEGYRLSMGRMDGRFGSEQD